VNPEEFSFRGQREGEEIVMVLHRHPWSLAKEGAIVAVGAVIIMLMFIWFQLSKPAIWTLFILGPLLLAYGAHAWYIWWNNLYLVTSERIIVLIHRSIFSRRVEDYGLDKIQSVASDTHGVASAMLNFGTVLLGIIGAKEPIQLQFVEDTYAVQEKILLAIKKMKRTDKLA
jgi:formate-dependent nitrite reductase membrane component NrfD